MELFSNLFEGDGTIKDVIVKLDIDPDVIPIVQLPRNVPQVMIEPWQGPCLNFNSSLSDVSKLCHFTSLYVYG